MVYKSIPKIYESPVSDLLIGRALATFVSSHVALHTPYDQFVKGKDALSVEQLEGLTVFLTPAKKDFVFNGKISKDLVVFLATHLLILEGFNFRTSESKEIEEAHFLDRTLSLVIRQDFFQMFDPVMALFRTVMF